MCFSDAEGVGCATMTDLYKSRTEADGMTAKGPIYVLDAVTNDVLITPTAITGKWLITSELYITGGELRYPICTYISTAPTTVMTARIWPPILYRTIWLFTHTSSLVHIGTNVFTRPTNIACDRQRQ